MVGGGGGVRGDIQNFGHTKFSYLSRSSSGYHQSFFNLIFSSRKFQSQQKLAKQITRFKIQFSSKNLTQFTNINSLDIENNMLPQHNQKPFWLYKFSANMFNAPFPRTAFLKHIESKCLCISLYLLNKMFVPET